jgi:hypothetical protein
MNINEIVEKYMLDEMAWYNKLSSNAKKDSEVKAHASKYTMHMNAVKMYRKKKDKGIVSQYHKAAQRAKENAQARAKEIESKK